MKVKLFIMFLFVCFSFSFSLVQVQASEDSKKGPFYQMDTNKDEMISKDEFTTYHMKEAEKRGKLFYNEKKQKTLTEEGYMRIFLKQQKIRGENVFKKIDKDSDGKLTREEANLAWDRIITDFLKNNNQK